MSTTVSIDPFTRIEGHLAVHLAIANGQVDSAQCSGEMFRGFEQILMGRDPLDAQQIVQRICGVCPASHGIASVIAQEEAYGITIPKNARLQRNIMLAGNYIQSHLTHFYHLSALDFIDVPAISNYQGNDQILQSLKEWTIKELHSDALFPAAPLLPQYKGEYLPDQVANLTLLRNYFIALEMRATAHQLVAIFAGKMPHMAAIIPGGISEKVTAEKIAQCRSKLAQLKTFINTAYKEDMLAIASGFPQYLSLGKSCGNFLSFGGFHQENGEKKPLLPAGVVLAGSHEAVDSDKISEQVRFSHYSADSGREKTTPQLDKKDAYSWIKAPRYAGEAVEVGPLARIQVAYASKESELSKRCDHFLHTANLSRSDLDSSLGRHLARFVELQYLADACEEWIEELHPGEATFQSYSLPQQAKGRGMIEAPRGALGHWLTIDNRKIGSYQCIVPTTWNCSPKDDQGKPGPVEFALGNCPIADPKNPLEAARIVRSFDPCLACAVH